MADILAVLTGDLVKSRRLSGEELDQVRAVLLAAAGEVKQWKHNLVRGMPQFFRGDAWQMLLGEPELALRVAVFLRASVLAGGVADTRVVIGLGTVDMVNSEQVSLSTGEAFMLSGRGLDGLTQHFRFSIAVSKKAGPLADWLRVIGHLCDMLAGHWTSRQAEIVRVALTLDEPTQAQVAERLNPPVSKQAVTKALAGADRHGLRSAMKQFERTEWRTIF